MRKLYFYIDYDDAFVAYLNGTEIARSANLPSGTPGISAVLTVDREAEIYQGGMPSMYVLSPSQLKTGDNILAVQVFNDGPNSSDMSARGHLDVRVESDLVRPEEHHVSTE